MRALIGALAPLLAAPASVWAADPPAVAPAGLYLVRDGNRVVARTYEGWRTWRALACDRCHGEAQQGLVGPSLLASLKVLTREEFRATVTGGRPQKGMPSFGANARLRDWEGLYAYLKGRSDGAIAAGPLSLLEDTREP